MRFSKTGYFLVIFTFLSVSAFPEQYEIIDLRIIGGSSNYALAINDNGWIVGKTFPSSNGGETAALWKDDTMIELGGTEGSWAKDINNKGQIIVNEHFGGCFIWKEGVRTNLFGIRTGHSINNNGAVVGYIDSGGFNQAVLWMNGVITILGNGYSVAWAINDKCWIAGDTIGGGCYWKGDGSILLGGVPEAMDINNLDQIIGSRQGSNRQAYLWDKGTISYLGNFGSDSYAYAINDRSQIVGHAVDQGGLPIAFIWEKDKITSLQSLLPENSGWYVQYAFDINNCLMEKICGYFRLRLQRKSLF